MTRRVIVGLIPTVLLGGCFRPMYADVDSSNSRGMREILASVAIDPAQDRVDQQIRNSLAFQFTGGGEAAVPQYRLHLDASSSSDTALVGGPDLTPQIDMNIATCEITLKDETGEKILLRAKVFARKSYQSGLQSFSSTRAQRDAENEVAKTLADQIYLRLVSYFSSHTS